MRVRVMRRIEECCEMGQSLGDEQTVAVGSMVCQEAWSRRTQAVKVSMRFMAPSSNTVDPVMREKQVCQEQFSGGEHGEDG